MMLSDRDCGPLPRPEDAERDVDAMIEALGFKYSALHGPKALDRGVHLALGRRRDGAGPKADAAAHSWHVADAIMLWGPHFPPL